MGGLTSPHEKTSAPREAALVQYLQSWGDWGALFLLIEIEIIVVVQQQQQHNREGIVPKRPPSPPSPPNREVALVHRLRAGVH